MKTFFAVIIILCLVVCCAWLIIGFIGDIRKIIQKKRDNKKIKEVMDDGNISNSRNH